MDYLLVGVGIGTVASLGLTGFIYKHPFKAHRFHLEKLIREIGTEDEKLEIMKRERGDDSLTKKDLVEESLEFLNGPISKSGAIMETIFGESGLQKTIPSVQTNLEKGVYDKYLL